MHDDHARPERDETDHDLLHELHGSDDHDMNDRREDPRDERDPVAVDAAGVGMTSGGPPSVVIADDSEDGSITGPRDRDQKDDARLERERAR